MAAEPGPPPEDFSMVCFCHGVVESEIRKAIAEGAKTIKEIQDRTRASTGCGGCGPEIEKILAEMLKSL